MHPDIKMARNNPVHLIHNSLICEAEQIYYRNDQQQLPVT